MAPFLADQDPLDPRSTRQNGSDKRTIVFAASISILVILAIIWFLKRSNDKDNQAITIIRAEEGPFKIKPEQTQTVVPYQDKKVYERLAPQPAKPTVERLTSEPEKAILKPIDPSHHALSSIDVPTPLEEHSHEMTAVDHPVSDDPHLIHPADELAPLTPITSDSETPEPLKAMRRLKSQTESSTLHSSNKTINNDQELTAEDHYDTKTSEEDHASIIQNMRNAKRKADHDLDELKTSQVKVKSKVSAETFKNTQMDNRKGGIRVQVSSLNSRVQAEQEWRRLLNLYPKIFKNVHYRIQRVDLGADKGIHFRLQFGPFASKERAQEFRKKCQNLKIKALIVP